MSQLIEFLAGLNSRLFIFVSVLHLDITANSLTNVKLSWPWNSVEVFVHHFAPMSHPSNTSADCKTNSEHLLWYSDCIVNHTCVIINVWIKFSFHKVFVLENFLLNFKCQFEDLFFLRVLFEFHKVHHFKAKIFHDCCSWIVALVYSVTKAHQTHFIILFFWFLQNLFNFNSSLVDVL